MSNNKDNNPNLLDRFKQGLQRFGELFKDNDSKERGDTTPCPGANGTSIGSFQQFNLLCGRNLAGDIIDESQQPNFLACIDHCASFHPRCDSVSFDGKDCRLKTGTGTAGSRSSKRFDSALGIFGTIPSDSGCNALGASTTLGSTKFDISCGFVINGNDLFQEHRTNFNDCLTLCSQTQSCAAISFDVDMDQGFQNCYLKRAATGGGLTTTSSSSSSSSTSSSTSTSTSSSSTSSSSTPPLASTFSSSTPVATSVAQSSAAATLASLVLETTPTAAASLPTTTPVAAATSTTVITSLVTQTSISEGKTSLLTSFLTSTKALTIPPASKTPSEYDTKGVEGIAVQQSSGSSPAVIAGSVVGSLIAVLIIAALVFAFWRKTRNQEAIDDGDDTETSAGRFALISAWVRGRLPDRSYDDKDHVSDSAGGGVAAFFGKLRRLGRSGGDDGDSRAYNEKMRATEQGIGSNRSSSQAGLRQEDYGDGASLRSGDYSDGASFRSGNYGDIGPVPPMLPMPTYDARRSGFFDLRDSMNGLAQHKPEFERKRSSSGHALRKSFSI
ncbi:hypothetical protein MCOR27_009398 [Pyricularia oryzae]|uniref:Apple domain-containing protein n=1 Tax=Pyricularia grisea TaxID=148305 RepID=A0ABQ8N6M4_PYRGI|nr:hypothetical protein MCOR01_010416 [Pyricularia oryzae]KAI6291648.1 hypothetical protein MCOR33_010448 [Pyricularia grisea]KAH9438602.1 hypothetical protein MCOR02_002218 [Pyricularia oryzae]KAI6257685.1 hypothetical protein MCOR19_005903 [Pyricularia oryzae]KAI6270216.1 hypothetical protein MCOR27_009398 [Pyricularia oryzae]